ncbi:MAG: SprT family zinc-dependent metalloprotease [Oscillospiraceae bacterium]|nr:SprT family zinc-dependent metalloprotease [Oscillospiraceae bacterium]
MSIQADRPHTTADIRREYDRLDKLCGVDTSQIELRISSRMVKRFGNFRYPVNGNVAPLRITISQAILSNDAQFYDTIRHEYAHAAVYLLHPGEQHNHDEVWREMCRRVGCNPNHTAEMTPEQEALRAQRAKYKIVCNECGQEVYYLRAGKIVNVFLSSQRSRVQCARCGSHNLTLFERSEKNSNFP